MPGLTADDAAKLKQALLLGKAAPAVGETEVERLAKLALAAQRSRFSRRVPPALTAGERVLPDDPRPVIGDAARSLAMQLFAGKTGGVDDPVARETARVLGRRGLRLHPFDLSRLEAFVAKHADALGAFERAWLRLVRPVKEREIDAEEPDQLTEETFAAAGQAAKLAFLRKARADDPARARRIIESAFPNEPAQARADMLAVLAPALGPDDRPFLESLTGDRAKSVKDAAESLLARLPGHPAYARRLADALALFALKTSGLLRRKAAIELKLGNDVKPHRAYELVSGKLEGLRLADLAAGLGLTPERFAEAAAENAHLARALLVIAVQDRRFDLADRMSAAIEEAADASLFSVLAQNLRPLPPNDRAAAVRSLLRPQRWKTFPPIGAWHNLHVGLRGPMPAETTVAIIASTAWRSALSDLAASEEKGKADLLATFAALVPAETSARFLAEIEPLPMIIKHRAATYHRLLAALTRNPSTAPA